MGEAHGDHPAHAHAEDVDFEFVAGGVVGEKVGFEDGEAVVREHVHGH